MQLLEVVQAVEDLLLGLIANRAGVVEDEVGIFFALHLLVAFGDERPHDLFRVVEIHLAPEGLNVKGFLLRAHNHPQWDQYIAGNRVKHRLNAAVSRSSRPDPLHDLAVGTWHLASGH